jgi:hypothetical protein
MFQRNVLPVSSGWKTLFSTFKMEAALSSEILVYFCREERLSLRVSG